MVMYYLRNSGGRIVQFDSHDEYQAHLGLDGFSVPTNREIIDFQESRNKAWHDMRRAQEIKLNYDKNAVYLATVTQGKGDGYSTSSGGFVKELQKLGVNIDTKNIGQKIALLYHNPYSLLRLEAPYRMIYTMFESTKIPKDWPDFLHAAEKVLVPSKWCQKVFAESGVESEVVPLGYDDDVFIFNERENKRSTRQDFIFLHYNAFNIRKGFIEVFKAFTQEFSKDEPVKLVLKTNLKHIPIPINPQVYPNIEIINKKMEAWELADLCADSDCFVFPSRGEGFGMTPLEAMATGLPTIVPNAHGITEYFNPEFMYEVEVENTCPGIYSKYKGQDVGDMVVCSVKHLRQQMRYIYEHQDEAMAKGRAASEYVKQWTYKQTAAKLNGIFQDIFSKPLPPRKDSNILTVEAF